jgi:hypothetical protein
MNGERALRLIRSIRTGTESTEINDLFLNNNNNNNKQSTSTASPNTTVTDEIDIVPYKCLCPYSTTSNTRNTRVKKSELDTITRSFELTYASIYIY